MAEPDSAPWRDRYLAARASVFTDRPGRISSDIARDLSDHADRPGPDEGVIVDLERLCHAVTAAVGVDGAAIVLMASGSMDGVPAATDERTCEVEELQYTGGDGPCHEAYALRRPVLVPDLAAADARRWPGYTSSALEHGFAAVFALPLSVGGSSLGVLDLLCDSPGPLENERFAMALTYAHLAVEILGDGRLIAADGSLDPALASALDGHAEVHQAQGMMMIALDVSLTEALARMRARAFSTGRPLVQIAREIVAGRETLE